MERFGTDFKHITSVSWPQGENSKVGLPDQKVGSEGTLQPFGHIFLCMRQPENDHINSSLYFFLSLCTA